MIEQDLGRASEVWREAKRAERDRMAELDRVIERAGESGMTERRLVSITGLNRNTVRRALGRQR